LLTAGLIAGVAKYKLNVTSYFPAFGSLLALANWGHFIHDNGLSALLALVVFWVYHNFRRNAQAEIEVMASMFSPDSTPHRWDRVEGRRELKWLTAMWVGIALVLITFIDEPRIFSATIMVYSACNIYGMVLYRRNVTRFLADSRFDPPPDDKHHEFIRQRREIQKSYLKKPHHRKEAMLFGGAAAACATAWPGLLPSALSRGAPLVLLIAVMAANELLVNWWRGEREQHLIRVEANEIESDIERIERDQDD
jgi:hypothetical protein